MCDAVVSVGQIFALVYEFSQRKKIRSHLLRVDESKTNFHEMITFIVYDNERGNPQRDVFAISQNLATHHGSENFPFSIS